MTSHQAEEKKEKNRKKRLQYKNKEKNQRNNHKEPINSKLINTTKVWLKTVTSILLNNTTNRYYRSKLFYTHRLCKKLAKIKSQLITLQSNCPTIIESSNHTTKETTPKPQNTTTIDELLKSVRHTEKVLEKIYQDAKKTHLANLNKIRKNSKHYNNKFKLKLYNNIRFFKTFHHFFKLEQKNF